MLLQPLKWKQLHMLVLGITLGSQATMKRVTNSLTELQAPALQDVTVQFRMVKRTLIYPRHNADYIDTCLKFEAALSKFPRHRLSLLGSETYHARRYSLMQGLVALFPKLRDGSRLTIDCAPCESPI